jgi:hypothetical protein
MVAWHEQQDNYQEILNRSFLSDPLKGLFNKPQGVENRGLNPVFCASYDATINLRFEAQPM